MDMLLSPAALALTLATFLLAGLVKGVIGMGLPTIAMGLLGTVMAPAQAAALLVLPSLVTNLWQIMGVPGLGALLRRLGPMMAAAALGTLLGIWAGLLPGRGGATAGLGVALLAYAGLGLLPLRLPQVPARAEAWAGPLTGLLTGLVTAATGVFVIPAVPYLQALGLGRDRLVQALGLSFTVSTLAMGVGLASGGGFSGAALGGSVLALLPALAGMGLGTWLRGRVSDATFRRCFFLGLLLLGLHLLWQGLR
ncbi:sulfite exporter TauE/SafE family protein [Roseomonas marmotae]|uniref:Probable membrane transporter protein n=1 Tax=Roseomonas marmotae TaxID=2768161 RepID=A0ABS3KBS5_9PROT|nr:sulfite exporter TauE/SafE family protein [Roseomonas marmotae]MBO1074919.1 sulfite exporter TauE/SafE family protein [Roseomonas marmotae]QTI80034.1 sulfite exporter TauE/SafE family protein [Roseomonas marmotae]